MEEKIDIFNPLAELTSKFQTHNNIIKNEKCLNLVNSIEKNLNYDSEFQNLNLNKPHINGKFLREN